MITYVSWNISALIFIILKYYFDKYFLIKSKNIKTVLKIVCPLIILTFITFSFHTEFGRKVWDYLCQTSVYY